MRKLKTVPHFKTEAEERKFWETHDSADSYISLNQKYFRFGIAT
jgi:CopG antitoxin of type II toxin-antitoxin system